jgi:FkbM family methyltransferase
MSVRLKFIYRAYRYRLRVDPGEIRFVRRNLRRGQVAVDIGCHKGAYAYWMRRSVGASGAVYAFEPQPKQVAYLREAFSAMRYDNVELVPMAVSDRTGQTTLHVPSMSSHFASLEAKRDIKPGTSSDTLVQITTLDDFFESSKQRRPPNFLKIDVEGHELSVLNGARRTLEEHHPTILVECETRHRADHDVQPVFDFLHSIGYKGSFFQFRQRRPLSDFNAEIHQKFDPALPRLPEGYVNNFAFNL